MKSPSTNKRTQALKAIAKRNFQAGNMSIPTTIQVVSQATASDAALDAISDAIPDAFPNPIPRSIPGTISSTTEAHSTSRKVSLLDIEEDLFDVEQNVANGCHSGVGSTVMPSQNSFTPTNSTRTKGAKNTFQTNATAVTTNLTLSIELLYALIKKTISALAKQIAIEEAELQAWVDLQVIVPAKTILALLRLAQEHHLDPLKEEVALALYEEGNWQAYITVEGWSKLLNCHPAFDGITFSESSEHANNIPIWMECTIYRKDRVKPIVIREYFEEVKGEQAIWQKMPRRMLRHRVMQQCARLAVG